jgi:hypothetical protein
MAEKNPFANVGLEMFGQELAGMPTSSKKAGPLSMLIGGLLQELGVGSESSPNGSIAPPDTNGMQASEPIAPPNPIGPVMPQLQNTQAPTIQSSSIDQAREALKQQIKMSLGIK